MAVREMRSSRREPVQLRWDDGREHAFPGSVPAKPIVRLMRAYGDSAKPEDLPNDAFMELVEGLAVEDGLAWLEENCTLTELFDAVRVLLDHHTGGALTEAEDGDVGPPASTP